MKRRLLALFLLTLTLVPWSTNVQATYSGPLDFMSHVVVACGREPNEVEIRFHNLTQDNMSVEGELWAKPVDGEPLQISSVPEPYRQLPPDAWGGPDVRLIEYYPNGFSGEVYGEARLYDANHQLLGTTILQPTSIDCSGNSPLIDLTSHTIAVCGQEPNEVEIRWLNETTQDLSVTGQIFAQPNQADPVEISSAPPPYQTIPPHAWGGPDTRISDHFPMGFEGEVFGNASLSDTHTLVTATLAHFPLNCLPVDPAPHRLYLSLVLTSTQPTTCDELGIWVTLPGQASTLKVFGDQPGPTYSFGDAFIAGQPVRFVTNDNQPVDSSYLGWSDFYSRDTGPGPNWELTATSQTGDPPLLGKLYTWQAKKALANGKSCSLGFLLQWDPI